MARTPLEQRLARQLAEFTHTEAKDWFVVDRARHGMECVFASIAAVRESGEIVTQPFTCLTAVNPILHSGHVPVYADIDPETLSIDPSALPWSSATRAIIAQHSLGMVGDLSALRELCDARASGDANNASGAENDARVVLVEDSAHCLGRISRDAQGRPLADVSVHSFGAEKIASTKFGAAIWLNPNMGDGALAAHIRRDLERLPRLSLRVSVLARAYRLTNAVLSRLPQPLSRPTRSCAERLGLFLPPVMSKERRALPDGRPSRASAWMIAQMLRACAGLATNYGHRATVASAYADALGSHEGLTVPRWASKGQPLLRFPLILPSPDQAAAAFQALVETGFRPGRWYRPTLFPGPTHPQAYNYDPATCPRAEQASASVLNLPTDVTPSEAERIAQARR